MVTACQSGVRASQNPTFLAALDEVGAAAAADVDLCAPQHASGCSVSDHACSKALQLPTRAEAWQTAGQQMKQCTSV
jgi:hypothetical protein